MLISKKEKTSVLVILGVLLFVSCTIKKPQEITWNDVEPYIKAYLYVDPDCQLRICEGFNGLDKISQPDSALASLALQSLLSYVLALTSDTLTLNEIFSSVPPRPNQCNQLDRQKEVWQALLGNQKFQRGLQEILKREAKGRRKLYLE